MNNYKKTEVYFVEYCIYEYNSGSGNNGDYVFEKKFLSLQEATEFYEKLSLWIKNIKNNDLDEREYKDFIEQNVWDGFLRFVGPIGKRIIEETRYNNFPIRRLGIYV